MNHQPDEMDIVRSDEPLHLSQDEVKVLDLYEQLEKLRLETAIVKAQNKYIPKCKPFNPYFRTCSVPNRVLS